MLLIAIAVSAIKMRVPVPTSAAGSSASDITAVLAGVSRVRHDAVSNGHTWDHIRADDDTIYSFNCDGRGDGKDPRKVASANSRGAVGRLVGNPRERSGLRHVGREAANPLDAPDPHIR
jgi:hypothetical protein